MVDVDVCVGIVIKCCMRRVDEGETESKGSRKIGVEKDRVLRFRDQNPHD